MATHRRPALRLALALALVAGAAYAQPAPTPAPPPEGYTLEQIPEEYEQWFEPCPNGARHTGYRRTLTGNWISVFCP